MASRRRVEDGRLALPISSAAKLVGVSERRLVHWERINLASPGIKRSLSERNTVRLYGFQDLLSLLVIRELFDRRMNTHQIHRVVEHLRSSGYDRPLTEVRFATEGNEIFFQHPDGTWEGDKRKNQRVFSQILDLRPLRDRIRESVENPRPKSAEGQIVRRRKVQGSKPVFSGTRIPISAVGPYIERGYTTSAILKAFPDLTKADIEAARKAAESVSA
jgi:DNA-binding transcriptional MerR regulator